MIDQAFRKAPFLRVLIPLSGGIIFSRYVPLPGWIIWLSAVLPAVSLGVLTILCERPASTLVPLLGPRNGLMAGLFQCLFLGLGWVLGADRERAPVPETRFQARICDEIGEGERSFRTLADRVYYFSEGQWHRLDGRVQVYLQKEERCRELLPGDFLGGTGRLEPDRDPANPFEFNYGVYQRGKGIGYHVFLDSFSWTPSPGHAGRGLKIRAKRLRLWLIDRMEEKIGGREEKAILYALLLGYRAEIGPDIRRQFARSGSMHILAVSGLHVGILYLLPSLLIRRTRGGLRTWTTGILLAGLWGYALLTGFSPSVVRAVTMCTIHRIAVLAGRKAGLYHVLTMTALGMVIARPGILFEAGFQLSFVAVAGIAGFMEPFSKVFRARGWFLSKVWQLVCVSMAAQLATAPLAMYYFHQFSHVFLLSNLVIIPLVTVILYVGLAFMGLALLGLYPLAGLLEKLAFLMHWITGQISSIPGAFSQHISLLPMQVLLLYVGVISLGFYFSTRKPLILQTMLAAMALFLLVSGIREYRVRTQERFCVFSVPRESAIGFVRGKSLTLLRAGGIRGDSLALPYALRNYAQRYKLGPPGREGFEYRRLDTLGTQFLHTSFEGRNIMIMRKLNEFAVTDANGLQADVLVLVENASCNPGSMIDVFKPGLVIVDGSSRLLYHGKVEKACRERGVPFHSTEKDGFFAF